MASELSLLIPEFRTKIITAITASKERGVQIDPSLTLVSPTEQAAKWKQGRSKIDAELKTLFLNNSKARFLADCMFNAIPKETNLVTDDIPGCSWHQWGEAITVVWVDGNRKINYSPKVKDHTGQNGYVVFFEECSKLGLINGNMLVPQKLFYVQYRPENTPLDLYSLAEIDTEMKRRYVR